MNMRTALSRPTVRLMWVVIATLGIVAAFPAGAIAQNEVTSANEVHYPGGYAEDPSNGIKVFLSSPRHASSGNRGECDANSGHHHGDEENINGRRYNWYAGRGQYAYEAHNPSSTARNLAARGYQNLVSQNTRDNLHTQNRAMSENGGYDIHIVTHSNAPGGNVTCPHGTNYPLVIHNNGDGISNNLSNILGDRIDDAHPAGPTVRWSDGPNSPIGINLGELNTAAPLGATYVEIAFHTNIAASVWMNSLGDGRKTAWRYGYAVDTYLNYP